jgi:hypothetical protein
MTVCLISAQQKHSNKGEKCLVAVDLEMKSNCIVISSSSNDEIEIFEDEEVTTDEKNKATRDLHDLSIPVYGRPKATLHAEELVKLCFVFFGFTHEQSQVDNEESNTLFYICTYLYR